MLQEGAHFTSFCARIPITSGDICLSFATSFIVFEVCIVKPLLASNDQFSGFFTTHAVFASKSQGQVEKSFDFDATPDLGL